MLLIGGRKRFIAGGDEHPVYRFALAGVARIDIAQLHMAPVLRQQLALLQADIAFLGEALDRENIAVIEARAFGLALDLGLAVFGDADAVAFGDPELRACGYTSKRFAWLIGSRPARVPIRLLQE